jgi:hypothetical protein
MSVFSNLMRSSTMSRSRTPRSGDVKPCPCGEGRPEAMTRRGPSRGHCYECTKTRNGRERSTEEHHPFGRDNPAVEKITVEVPGNWHRALDARRARLPEILKRPGDNPLHRIAAVVARLGQAADAFSDFTRRELWPAWAANLADLSPKAPTLPPTGSSSSPANSMSTSARDGSIIWTCRRGPCDTRAGNPADRNPRMVRARSA